MKIPSRFAGVNGHVLRERRLALGWSQCDLAQVAGYSERLIRKAESGGSLRLDTINDLARALSTGKHPLAVEDLIHDIAATAGQVVEAYDRLGAHMLDACRHLLADDFVWNCPGDPQRAPFAGTWHGADGLQEWLEIFFGVFSRTSDSITASYRLGANRVLASYNETLYLRGQPLPPLWIDLHFQFQNGLIVRIDDQSHCQAAGDLHAL